jgi:hypothetical protein
MAANAVNGQGRGRLQGQPSQRRLPGQRLLVVLLLMLLAAAAGCKPGDPGGGTARDRSMASPASTPTPSRPEPQPGSNESRTTPTAPPSASGPR